MNTTHHIDTVSVYTYAVDRAAMTITATDERGRSHCLVEPCQGLVELTRRIGQLASQGGLRSACDAMMAALGLSRAELVAVVADRLEAGDAPERIAIDMGLPTTCERGRVAVVLPGGMPIR
jgi:hypothetical protein